MEDRYEALRLDRQLCFPLYAAARQVVNRYAPFLKDLGLTYTQYLVFLALWERDGMTVGELGKALYLDCGTLSPLLKKLEGAGYVVRERAREDERVVRLRLTEAGWALRARAAHVPGQVGACVKIAPESAARLYELLHELLDNMREEETPSGR